MQLTLFRFLKLIFLFLFAMPMAFATNDAKIFTEKNLVIAVSADHPTFSIKLKSNMTTGYSWFLKQYSNRLITPVTQHYVPPLSQLAGAPGMEVWTFKVTPEAFVVPHQTQIHFIYARPWEKSGDQDLIFTVDTSK